MPSGAEVLVGVQAELFARAHIDQALGHRVEDTPINLPFVDLVENGLDPCDHANQNDDDG